MIERVGNCRIIEEIGAGGMAVVYKAIQEPLGRTVAVKALKSAMATDKQFSARFMREAHFMASMQHENVLHVYDFLFFGGTCFIILEFVEGIDLYDLLEKCQRLPVEVASIIALQTARALDHAHFRGIIHRDIKPANIMISKSGTVKLMDFGIARDDSLQDLTETGAGLGTPSYMSPEQIVGEKLDFRTDVFSLGIVLYQTLTGRKPFLEDDLRSVMHKIRLERYTSPRKLNPAVPRSLERILARCMEKLPHNRYPSMQALIHDLEDFLASRVSGNYSARLVNFLAQEELLAHEEAEKILAPGRGSVGKSEGENRHALRQIMAVQAALMLVIIACSGFLRFAFPESEASAPQQERPALITSIDDAGYLQVSVRPWAHVYVDGQHVATTPTARRFALAPGRHFVRLENPYFSPHEEAIMVTTGATVTVQVELSRASSEHAP
jgi:eukaryotic-like serine/threonine-protein kinase